MPDDAKIPTGRWGRLTKLARAGAHTGIALVRSKAAEASVERVAQLLGEMRGIASKVGQMASYVDGLVPEEQRELFEKSLSHLRTAAPRSSAAEIRRIVEEELRAPIDRVFAAWSEEPIASASIGQVHRATLLDGRAVAVKVQHVGIQEAMESDLRNAGVFDTTARALGLGRFEVGRFVDEARQRFREELDYRLEAERARRFAKLHQGDAEIVVPVVVDHASSARVLTTGYIEALEFQDAVAASSDLRRRWAGTMWRFVYGSIMCGGVFNADPHPGNYRFFPDGRVGFLDFGCVQEVTPFHQRSVVLAHQAANERDFAGFEARMARLLGAREGRHRNLMADYMRLAIQPILASPFHLSREYARRVVAAFREMATGMASLPAAEFRAIPPGILFLNRLQFGFYSVLARIDVEVDYAAEEQALLPRALASVEHYPDARD